VQQQVGPTALAIAAPHGSIPRVNPRIPAPTLPAPESDLWPAALPPVVREAAVLALLATSALLSLLVVPDRGVTPAAVALALAPLLPLPWRHVAPVRVFVLVQLLALGTRVAFGPNGPADLIVLVALYAIASRRGLGVTAAAVGVDVGLLGAATAVAHDLPVGQLGGELLGQAAIDIVVALFGAYLASRRSHLHAVEDRARRLERTHELEAQAAVDEERRRIARELHDVVAHHVSVMTLHAGALQRHLEVSGADAELTAAAEGVRTTGQEAMQELGRMLDVLHREREGEHTAPQPTLRDLDILVDRMREVGMPVDLTVDGPTDDVPPGVALAVYRIAQEALTNTLRHAGPVPTEVDLVVAPAAVRLEVRDHGTHQAPPRYPLDVTTGGKGLRGMRERAALYAGHVTAQRHPEGGFVVRAEIPRSAERAGRSSG
jgi:signal transduction histidine kinase